MANLLFLVPRVKVVPAYLSGPSPLAEAWEEGVTEVGEEGRVEERREAMGQPPVGTVGKGEDEVVGMGGWSAGSSKGGVWVAVILLRCL
jgi:hypothetical protein